MPSLKPCTQQWFLQGLCARKLEDQATLPCLYGACWPQRCYRVSLRTQTLSGNAQQLLQSTISGCLSIQGWEHGYPCAAICQAGKLHRSVSKAIFDANPFQPAGFHGIHHSKVDDKWPPFMQAGKCFAHRCSLDRKTSSMPAVSARMVRARATRPLPFRTSGRAAFCQNSCADTQCLVPICSGTRERLPSSCTFNRSSFTRTTSSGSRYGQGDGTRGGAGRGAKAGKTSTA